ncbi:MAG: hypothetical protein ACYCVN_04925 [Acidimicrobiales bacterium]
MMRDRKVRASCVFRWDIQGPEAARIGRGLAGRVGRVVPEGYRTAGGIRA